ncbi:UDP-glucose 4-epimerase GalE [Hyphococcus sp.]|uniref:UDP-glucose 4-epimerase GalE n=1 Tax=Hyphococcus sp. TaxID=2038636 RepID=UPI003CCC2278
MIKQRIIVAGGAGYIGSHVCVELLSGGASLLIIDNFANSHPEAINRIKELAGAKVDLLQADLADPSQRKNIVDTVKRFQPTGGIHLAGLKAVGESVAEPARYYRINMGSALTMAEALEAAGAKMLVFSSSATVYGEENENPVAETGAASPTNPYGRTKYFIECMLKDIAEADPHWRIINLRYFNPVGAHPSGRIGENPNGVPNNLFPYIAQVAVGKREMLNIFGNDYPTKDGTGVRDYIHVCDLAKGHAAALRYLDQQENGCALDMNLGTGAGYSVLEAVAAFKRASNRDIPYAFAPRRDGDVAEIFANAELAENLLDWRAQKSLEDMCADHWRWQSQNPDGYET